MRRKKLRQNPCDDRRMDYRDLVAWQKSMDLAERIYIATAKFPKEERYGLISQIRRASVSVPSNIAEGQGRRSSDDEFVRFLQIAMGSLAELETQIELAVRLSFLEKQQAIALRSSTDEVGRLLTGLIKSKRQ
jgi:four helix bundle protein